MITLDVFNEKTQEFVPYDNWKSLSFSRSMENLNGQFSFVASKADDGQFPIKRRSKCRVLINSVPVITGFIDAMTPAVSVDENAINVQGRDRTADFLDSTLNAGSVELQEGITLQGIIEKTVQSLGQDLEVIDEVGDLEPFSINDLASSEASEGAFDFCEKFCRLRQVLLTTNGDGNLVITRSSEQLIDFALINRKDGVENNVKTASISYDDSQRFNRYIVVSQGNPIGLNLGGAPDLDQIVDSEGAEAVDEEIRTGRVLYLTAEKSATPDDNRKRALWEANWRKSQSLKYNATSDDFTIPETGEPFTINRLIKVQDQDNDVQAIMLIEAISISSSVDGGTIASFGLVPRDAYTTKLEQPVVQEASSQIGLTLE